MKGISGTIVAVIAVALIGLGIFMMNPFEKVSDVPPAPPNETEQQEPFDIDPEELLGSPEEFLDKAFDIIENVFGWVTDLVVSLILGLIRRIFPQANEITALLVAVIIVLGIVYLKADAFQSFVRIVVIILIFIMLIAFVLNLIGLV